MNNVFKCIGREEKCDNPEFMINFDDCFINFRTKKIVSGSACLLVALIFQSMLIHLPPIILQDFYMMDILVMRFCLDYFYNRSGKMS